MLRLSEQFMKSGLLMKNKSVAYIYWGIGVFFLLGSLLLMDNGITKQVVFGMILAAVWLVGGLVYWKRRK